MNKENKAVVYFPVILPHHGSRWIHSQYMLHCLYSPLEFCCCFLPCVSSATCEGMGNGIKFDADSNPPIYGWESEVLLNDWYNRYRHDRNMWRKVKLYLACLVFTKFGCVYNMYKTTVDKQWLQCMRFLERTFWKRASTLRVATFKLLNCVCFYILLAAYLQYYISKYI